MALMRRLTALAGAAEAARRYARKNPDKAGRFVDKAAAFVDKQTKGKYSGQIRGAADKAKNAAGLRHGPHPGGPAGGPGQPPYPGTAQPPEPGTPPTH